MPLPQISGITHISSESRQENSHNRCFSAALALNTLHNSVPHNGSGDVPTYTRSAFFTISKYFAFVILRNNKLRTRIYPPPSFPQGCQCIKQDSTPSAPDLDTYIHPQVLSTKQKRKGRAEGASSRYQILRSMRLF